MIRFVDQAYIKQAVKFVEDIGEDTRGWGATWVPLYHPSFDEDSTVLDEEYAGGIECRGIDFGDEESDTYIIDLDRADEDLAEAICLLHNSACDVINNLLGVIKDQQERRAGGCITSALCRRL